MGKKVRKLSRFQRLEPIFKKILIAAFGIYLALYAVNFAKNLNLNAKVPSKNATVVSSLPRVVHKLEPRPKYWFYMARGYMWIFFSVDNVLKKLGLQKIEIKVNNRETVHNDWDLLWSYDYHNEIPIDFKNLKYHQKINHIPGNFVLCKVEFFVDRKFSENSIFSRHEGQSGGQHRLKVHS